MSYLSAAYTAETERVYPQIWEALEGIGHMWTFDARDEEIWCKDCDWALDHTPFLEAIKYARVHRDDIKVAVLNNVIASLLDPGE